jgi:hypothetical protein
VKTSMQTMTGCDRSMRGPSSIAIPDMQTMAPTPICQAVTAIGWPAIGQRFMYIVAIAQEIAAPSAKTRPNGTAPP